MSLTLTVDGERWRGHLRRFAEATPGLVPVAKGNGYGFTLGRLARKAQWLADQGLGCDTLAVGTYEELPEVASRYAGDLLVLTPWRPFHAARPTPRSAGRVVHTVSRPDDLAGLLEAQPGRPVRARARDLDAPARHDRPAAVGASRSSSAAAGSRASHCTSRSPRAATSPRSSGCSPTWSPRSSRPAPSGSAT